MPRSLSLSRIAAVAHWATSKWNWRGQSVNVLDRNQDPPSILWIPKKSHLPCRESAFQRTKGNSRAGRCFLLVEIVIEHRLPPGFDGPKLRTVTVPMPSYHDFLLNVFIR